MSSCCNYVASVTKTKGYDCILIPGASTFTNQNMNVPQICGSAKGIGTGAASSTVCSELRRSSKGSPLI